MTPRTIFSVRGVIAPGSTMLVWLLLLRAGARGNQLEGGGRSGRRARFVPCRLVERGGPGDRLTEGQTPRPERGRGRCPPAAGRPTAPRAAPANHVGRRTGRLPAGASGALSLTSQHRPDRDLAGVPSREAPKHPADLAMAAAFEAGAGWTAAKTNPARIGAEWLAGELESCRNRRPARRPVPGGRRSPAREASRPKVYPSGAQRKNPLSSTKTAPPRFAPPGQVPTERHRTGPAEAAPGIGCPSRWSRN